MFRRRGISVIGLPLWSGVGVSWELLGFGFDLYADTTDNPYIVDALDFARIDPSADNPRWVLWSDELRWSKKPLRLAEPAAHRDWFGQDGMMYGCKVDRSHGVLVQWSLDPDAHVALAAELGGMERDR